MISAILARRPWLGHVGPGSYGFTTAAPRPEATEVASRLIAAYHRAIADAPAEPRQADMWAEIGDRYHRDILELAEAGKPSELAEYLRCLPMRAAGHGFIQGEASYEALVADPESQRGRAIWLMDHLAGMAEGCGVLDMRCPEQGDFWAPSRLCTASELRLAIEERIGAPLSLPETFEGLFALDAQSRPVHLRTLMGAYVAWRATGWGRGLLDLAPERLRMAEIGAGIGFSAYTAYSLGVRDYEIYDLPAINLVQGYFLSLALPPGTVSFYGEPPANVRVQPSFTFDGVRGGAFDIAINVDSLPEISPEEAHHYAERLQQASSLFYSINQEARAPQTIDRQQLVVRELFAGRPSLLRYPNWVRPGYVDELWAMPAKKP